MKTFSTADGEDFQLKIVDCEDGKASVCAVFASETREDPGHADIPREEAEKAVSRYESDEGVSGIDLRAARKWPIVDIHEPLL